MQKLMITEKLCNINKKPNLMLLLNVNSLLPTLKQTLKTHIELSSGKCMKILLNSVLIKTCKIGFITIENGNTALIPLYHEDFAQK